MTLSSKHRNATRLSCPGSSTTASLPLVAISEKQSSRCTLAVSRSALAGHEHNRRPVHLLWSRTACPDHRAPCRQQGSASRRPKSRRIPLPLTMDTLLFTLYTAFCIAILGGAFLVVTLVSAWLFDHLILWPLWRIKRRRWIDRMCVIGASIRADNTPEAQ